MAQRIPIIEQTVGTTMGPGGVRAQGSQYTSPFAAAANTAAQGLSDINDARMIEEQQHNITAVNDTYANSFSPTIRKLLYDPQDGLMAKQGKDAVSALPDVEKAMETARTQTMATFQNDYQRKTFDSIARKHLQMELDGAYRHAQRENQVWQAQTSDAVVNEKLTSSVDHFNDPKWVDGAIGSGLYEIQAFGAQHGQSAEVVLQRSQDFVRKTRTAITQRLMIDDPLAAQKYLDEHASELAGPQFPVLVHQVRQAVLPVQAKTIANDIIKKSQETVGPDLATENQSAFDNTMAFVFSKEGGYSASDGNTGKPVNFGINQKANPDVDVKSLTKEQAAGIYRQRYWNAIGGDSLPPATAMMAMDAAVNQGVPFAKKILAESGGDVSKMAEMRRAQYQQIAANDPTLNRYKGTWLARVDDAEAQAKAQPSAAPKSADIKAQMGDMITQAQAEAERLHPGDPVFADLAVSQVKAHLNNIVAQQVAVQQQAHGVVIQALIGQRGAPKPTTIDELPPVARQAFAMSTPEAQRGYIAMLDHNAKEATGSPTKSNPAVVQQTFARIHLPDGDPKKITVASQLAPLFAQGLNREDYDWMKKELDAQQSAGGRSRSKDMELAATTAKQMLSGSIIGGAQPELADEAAYRFRLDVASKVEAYEKAGKDPRTLYTPGSPDYVLDPAKVMSYLQTPQQAVAAQAKAIAESRAPAAAPAKVSSDAEYEALPNGARFVGPDGKVRVKP